MARKNEYERELAGDEPISDIEKEIAQARAAREKVRPEIQKMLDVTLEEIPYCPDHWRMDISTMIPKKFILEDDIKQWLNDASQGPDVIAKRAAALNETIKRVFARRLPDTINRIAPASVSLIVPQSGAERDASRRRKSATGIEESAFEISDTVLYLSKLAVTETRRMPVSREEAVVLGEDAVAVAEITLPKDTNKRIWSALVGTPLDLRIEDIETVLEEMQGEGKPSKKRDGAATKKGGQASDLARKRAEGVAVKKKNPGNIEGTGLG